jgi:glycosyltransferase involved in cell wall biosynthesis
MRANPRISHMKVLHVIPSISVHAGGPSQAIFPMCRALREQGVDLLLATTDDGLSGENGTAPLQYEYIGDYQGQPTIFFSSQIGASFKYSRPFAQWLNSNVANYDVVHIHAVFNHACISAARACRKHEVPYIVRPLGTLDPWGMKQKRLRKKVFWQVGVKRMLSSAAAVHYTAKAEQTATEQSLGLNHGVVIPLGIDPQTGKLASRNTLARKLPSLGEHSYVLVLSRLLPTKGIDVLLEAFLALVKQTDFAQWRLVLAGEGPVDYVATLKQTVAATGASEQVLFPGWLDGIEKEAALGNAALLALPSHHENFGLCVMEALSWGVPVLVSPQVSLAAEIEAAGAGWVAEIDRESIQSALEAALNSDEDRIQRGVNGRMVAGRFNWSVIAARLTELYSSILESKTVITAVSHI